MKHRLLYRLVLTGLLAGTLNARGETYDPNTKPDDNRFTVVRLTQPNTLNEPMEFQVLKDGRTFIIERRGGIKMFNPATQSVQPVGMLTVNNSARVGNGEQGLVGMTLDPNFVTNGWMYLYYFHPTEEKGVFSRWEIRDNVLVANSEKVLFEWPAQRETCCHTGGGMAWDADGNLFITIGNNRGNHLSAHTDERPGRAPWDDQGGTANSNSLEGKILRIHPEPDGTYTIPKGNLFPPGTPHTRPEIYTMGHRNAWRVSVDSHTGYIYWGEVGPDAQKDSEIGPMGYDELNQARHPGFFGWPYFVGESAFPMFDYANNKPGAYKDPQHPVNNSPNNTGIHDLPPLEPAFIYYPYRVSDKFPVLGSGGRSATGGPIYHRDDLHDPKRPWPAYYEGKWLAADLSRRLIVSISMDEHSNYKSMERFLPDYKPVEPIDLKFGPEGDLYVLEYGGRWFQPSPEAKLVRIEFEGGNRKPVAIASADKIGGIPPFPVNLSSIGTEDFDHDPLTYRWDVTDIGGNTRTFKEANPTVTLDGLGTYVASLTVTDPSGASDSKSVKIVSGNEPPEVTVKVTGNETFYFPNKPFGYEVNVTDHEDGSVKDGRIPADKVSLSINYASADFDLKSLASLTPGDEAAAKFPVAQALIAKGNCKSCHLPDANLVGPAFAQVAEKYRHDPDAPARLAKKIVAGGAGVWGQVAMPPNAAIDESEAAAILKYVLSLGEKNPQNLPLAGEFNPVPPEGDDGNGSFIIRATYTDKGEEIAPPLSGQGIRLLRSPTLTVAAANKNHEVARGGFGASVKAGSYLAYNNVDLTGINELDVTATAISFANHKGGDIEIRLGSPAGKLIGRAKVEVRQPNFAGGRGRGGQAPDAPDADAARPVAGNNAARPPAAGGGNRPARANRRGGGRGRGFAPPPTTIKLAATSGRNDLFIVFANKDAGTDDTLMTVSSFKLSE